MNKSQWFLSVLALVVGAVGGYISGKSSTVGDAPTEVSAQRTRSSTRALTSAETSAAKKTRGSGGIEQIAHMPGISSRVQALLDFYGNLTPEQLREEASKLESLPLGERMMASFLLFGRWAEVDATAAMAFSNSMGMAGGFVRPTILQSWASVDPANAAKYYTANPREFAMMDMMGGGRGGMNGKNGASSIIATEWARQDPSAALAWADSLTSGKADAVSAVIGEVAKTDPRKAAAMLGTMDPTERAGAYRAVAAEYGALDFAEAEKWVQSLPASERDHVLASAIGGLSNKDPFSAAKQVSTMQAGDAKDGLIVDVVGDLARKDPQAAADFLKEQTSAKAQQDAMRQLMPSMTSKNPIAALAFVNSYQPGAVRDSAAQAYVWSNNSGSPADLVQVAETITDEGDRSRTVGIAAMRWMREDATAAKAYIETSSALSDEAKQRITEGRGMWGGGGNRGGN